MHAQKPSKPPASSKFTSSPLLWYKHDFRHLLFHFHSMTLLIYNRKTESTQVPITSGNSGFFVMRFLNIFIFLFERPASLYLTRKRLKLAYMPAFWHAERPPFSPFLVCRIANPIANKKSSLFSCSHAALRSPKQENYNFQY